MWRELQQKSSNPWLSRGTGRYNITKLQGDWEISHLSPDVSVYNTVLSAHLNSKQRN